jgi:hypothetical protein
MPLLCCQSTHLTITVGTCAGLHSFGSINECLRVCATYPLSATGSATDENTLECRESYANASAAAAAIGDDVTTYCYYATSHGGGLCGTVCQVSSS